MRQIGVYRRVIADRTLVPEIIRPPRVPVAVPRIRTEEVVFAESRFVKHINEDTGEVWVESVY